MTARWDDFTVDPNNHPAKKCGYKFCRIHWFWDFQAGEHTPYPGAWNILTSRRGWVNQRVFCGPAAWMPKKPTRDHLSDMRHHCPHVQVDLTCNYCMRHTFRLLEI